MTDMQEYYVHKILWIATSITYTQQASSQFPEGDSITDYIPALTHPPALTPIGSNNNLHTHETHRNLVIIECLLDLLVHQEDVLRIVVLEVKALLKPKQQGCIMLCSHKGNNGMQRR